MKSLAAVTNPSSPPNPPKMGDFEREILSESPPIWGLGAEVLNNEAEKLHRIHVRFKVFLIFTILEHGFQIGAISRRARTPYSIALFLKLSIPSTVQLGSMSRGR